MREFSKFDADFRILKADCRGMGEDEAKNIYQSALPLFLAEAVQKELLRKERRPTALLQGLGPMPIKQTREWLDETLSTSFHHISNENGNFVVHCVDDTQFRKLMGLNGRALTNGQNISVTARDAQVSLEEIRKICHDLLEPRELVQEMKFSANPNKRFPENQAPRPMARVQEMGGEIEEDASANGAPEPHHVAEVAQATPSAARGPPQGARQSKGSPPHKGHGKGSGTAPPASFVSSSSSSSSPSRFKENENEVKPTQNVVHDFNFNFRSDPPPPPPPQGKGYTQGISQSSNWTPPGQWNYSQNTWHGKGDWSGKGYKGEPKGGKGKGKGNNGKGGRGPSQGKGVLGQPPRGAAPPPPPPPPPQQ